jgi:hypothetical protein
MTKASFVAIRARAQAALFLLLAGGTHGAMRVATLGMSLHSCVCVMCCPARHVLTNVHPVPAVPLCMLCLLRVPLCCCLHLQLETSW